MNDIPVPPHPGPAPAEFAYPFHEARAVLGAGDALEAGIAAVIDLHHAAAGAVRAGFEGATRTDFDAGLAEVTARLDGDLGVLRGDLGALEDDIALARQRREESLDAIADHEVAVQTHRRAVAAAEAAEAAESAPVAP